MQRHCASCGRRITSDWGALVPTEDVRKTVKRLDDAMDKLWHKIVDQGKLDDPQPAHDTQFELEDALKYGRELLSTLEGTHQPDDFTKTFDFFLDSCKDSSSHIRDLIRALKRENKYYYARWFHEQKENLDDRLYDLQCCQADVRRGYPRDME